MLDSENTLAYYARISMKIKKDHNMAPLYGYALALPANSRLALINCLL
jgi:hypothetical protein